MNSIYILFFVIFIIFLMLLGEFLYVEKKSILEQQFIKGFISNPDSNPNPKPDSNTNPNPNPDSNPNLNPNLNPDSNPNSNSNSNPNSNLNPNANSNSNPNSNLNPNPNTNPNSNSNSNSNPNPNPNPNSNSNPNTTILDKIGNISKATFTDPNFYISAAIDILIQKLIKKATEKIGLKVSAKAAFKSEEIGLKTTTKVLSKLFEVKGSEFAARLGLRAGEKASIKASERIGEKIGVKIGTILAADTAAASSTGPFAPFVEAGLLAFDVLSLTADLTDAFIPGGTVGYSKMGTVQGYQEMRDGIMKAMKEEFEKDNLAYPLVIGPIDKLSQDDLIAQTKIQTALLLADTNGIIYKKMNEKIQEDINNKAISEDTDYSIYIDYDQVYQIASDNVCIALNGKFVIDSKKNSVCSYKDRNTCETSYDFPLKEDSEQTYAEYKNNIYGGSCVSSSYGLRGICKENNLPYDSEKGTCIIDEKYCKMKGADWTYNDAIKENDCMVNQGQSIAELIFGTTVVRGLKQIFDPAQYEKCKPNETDNPYSCVSCPDGYEVNKTLNDVLSIASYTASPFSVSVTSAAAVALSTTGAADLCYQKCEKGYHKVGDLICSPDCKEGYTDDGISCRRAGYCPSNEDHVGGFCYTKCKPGYYQQAGTCWESCKSNEHDDGAFCRIPLNTFVRNTRQGDKKLCDANQRDDGTSCWLDTYGVGVGRIADYDGCGDDYNTFQLTCTRKGCGGHYNSSWGSIGCTGGRGFRIQGYGDCYSTWIASCFNDGNGGHGIDTYNRTARCHDNEESNGAGMCYPKCKPGYHKVGWNLCEPDGGPGIKKSLFDRTTCNADEDGPTAALCTKKCPSGYGNVGLNCSKGGEVRAKQSYIPDMHPDTEIYFKPVVGTPGGGGAIQIKPANLRIKHRDISFSTKDN